MLLKRRVQPTTRLKMIIVADGVAPAKEGGEGARSTGRAAYNVVSNISISDCCIEANLIGEPAHGIRFFAKS